MKKVLSVLSLIAAFSTVANEPLQLNVSVYLNNELVLTEVIQTESGELQSIAAPEVLKFEVTPTLNDDIVTLTSSMYKYQDGAFDKFVEPQLRVTLDKLATFEVDAEDANIYKVEITTKKI